MICLKKIEWTDERLSSLFSLTITSTDYGRAMKPFFIKIPNFWAWADKFWGIWGIFGRFISTQFGTVSSLSMFSIDQPLFLQKTKPLYPNPKIFWDWDLNLGCKESGI